MEIPQNKPLINGKYKTKEAIKTAIYNLLKKENVEGRYSDENWEGINSGQGEVENSSLPTRKVYRFELSPRDKEGKVVPLYLKVTCAFVGRTGTMADSQYEITYYFF
jgi:hypothetical protein